MIKSFRERSAMTRDDTVTRKLPTGSPERYPRRSRRTPKLSQSCRTFAQRSSSSCLVSRDWTQHRPNLAVVGHIWADLGQTSAAHWPIVPGVGRLGRHLGRCWPSRTRIGQTLPKPTSTNMSPISTNVCRVVGKNDPHRSKSGSTCFCFLFVFVRS